ncbi:MAG: hydrogenase small subunit [Kineosporiaceae bacterium]
MTDAGLTDLPAALLAHDVDRRTFLSYCAGLTATLALPATHTQDIADALAAPDRPPVVWLEFQSCTGDTESLLRAHSPSVGDLVLDQISLDYHETLMAPAGRQAETSLADALERGGHILVIEGSVPLADGGVYCTIAGRTAEQHLTEAAASAAAVINVGTCSAFGGIPAADPNPTGAVAVGDVVSGVPVLNLPGCPVNADTITATVAHYLAFGALPAADDLGRPLFAYGDRIHDTCPRRGYFDAGLFALEWGDEGHRQGWCLYKMGCKGPATFHSCPLVKWNQATSWPIGAGHGCVGCSEPAFWDTMSPFYERLPEVEALGYSATAQTVGLTVAGATAAGFAAHGVGKYVQHRIGVRRDRQAAGAADVAAPGDGEGPAGPPATEEARP